MIPLISGLLLLAFAAAARGEEHSVIQTQPPASFSPWWASTIAEGYFRGLADLERADGACFLNYSQGIVNLEEARRRSIENHAAEVRTWFQLREENRRWRAAERRPLNASLAQAPAKKAAPAGPVPTFQLAADGSVEWPSALRGSAFAAQRAQVESVLAARARGRHASSAELERLRKIRQAMLDALKLQIRELPTLEYLAATKCVKTLTDPNLAITQSERLAVQ